MRSAASASSSSPIRCRSPFRKVSDTASTQAVATPSRPPSVNSVAASISTATAPPPAPGLGARPGRPAFVGAAVVEEIRGHDPRRREAVLGLRGQRRCQLRVRLRDLAGPERPARAVLGQRVAATTSSPWTSSGSSAPQVPTRIARRTPSSASSCRTIAALGPPMPVDWMLSGRPSGVSPVYPQSPRAWLLIRGSVEQLLRERQRAARVAGKEHVRRVRGARPEVMRHEASICRVTG